LAYFPSSWTDTGEADPFVLLSGGQAVRWSRLYTLFWRMCFTNKFMHTGEDPTKDPGSNEANKKARADAWQRSLFVAGINVSGVARCYM